jgi:hypothetical protein
MMSIDMNYQVVRKFGGYQIGQVVPVTDFASPRRAAQLISQRYLAPAQSTAVQPTVKALLNATVRKVSELVPQVQDRCVLEAALAQEEREVARKAIAKRLEELDAESNQ